MPGAISYIEEAWIVASESFALSEVSVNISRVVIRCNYRYVVSRGDRIYPSPTYTGFRSHGWIAGIGNCEYLQTSHIKRLVPTVAVVSVLLILEGIT